MRPTAWCVQSRRWIKERQLRVPAAQAFMAVEPAAKILIDSGD
jgi:hypothetical protein